MGCKEVQKTSARAFAKDCYEQLERVGEELAEVIGDKEEGRLHINTPVPSSIRYLWPALAPERAARMAHRQVHGIVPRAIHQHFNNKGFEFEITCRCSLRCGTPLTLSLTGCKKPESDCDENRRHPYFKTIALCLSRTLFRDIILELYEWVPHPDDTAKALLNLYLSGDLSIPDDPSSLFPGSKWRSSSYSPMRHM